MMNKKFVQAILFVGVLSIWGMVGYRLFKSGEGNSGYSSPVTTLIDNKSRQQHENYTLSLNYDDPFLKHQVIDRSHYEAIVRLPQQKTKKQEKPKKDEQKPASPPLLPWPEIQYKGIIENHKKGMALGIISIKGSERIVRSNDLIGEFSILLIDKNQLVVKNSAGESKTYSKM